MHYQDDHVRPIPSTQGPCNNCTERILNAVNYSFLIPRKGIVGLEHVLTGIAAPLAAHAPMLYVPIETVKSITMRTIGNQENMLRVPSNHI